jgi:hypothetical protein
MVSSRKSTTTTNDGDKHQSDNYSRSGTNPVSRAHPNYGMLTLPEPSDVGTVDEEQEPITRGSSKVPSSGPPSRTPSDDRLMTEDDIKKAMPGMMEEYIKGRRAAGKSSIWDVGRRSDDDGRKDVPETSSAVSKPQGRRMSRTALPKSSGVSKKPRTVPVRSKTNEEQGTTPRRLRERGGTRLGLRSQTTAQRSQDDEVRTRARDTAVGFEDDVDQMSINDQRL